MPRDPARFCGKCGTRYIPGDRNDRRKKCPQCDPGLTYMQKERRVKERLRLRRTGHDTRALLEGGDE